MKLKGFPPPKTLLYSGDYRENETIINHYLWDENHLKKTDNFSREADQQHYIQVIGLNDVNKIKVIKNTYDIEDIVLEDIFNVKQRNKIEFRSGYIFAVFHCQYLLNDKINDEYMSVLLFNGAMISFHEHASQSVDLLSQLIHERKELRKKTIDYLFFQLLDLLTDRHLHVYEALHNEVSAFEEEILESKSLNQEQFYLTRKHLLKLKNNIAPVLNDFEELLSQSTALINSSNLEYYEDLHDHLIRLDNHLSESREMMRHLLDLHINNQSNTMNRIMTTLTLFSAIFIPLSFLTGFFGMNFVYFEFLEYEYGLLIFILLCIALAGFMIALFKKMRWF